METRANYVAIGIFVLIVLTGAFAALWWLYRSGESGATSTLRIIFPEAVTGLSTGASVNFNGIRVGEVTSLQFPPEGGDNVIAITRVSPAAPIKVDTQAQLASQGLTGVSYVSLIGGSGDSIFDEASEGGEIPTIEAETSAFTNVVDTLQSVLSRLDDTLGGVTQLVSTNQGNIGEIVANVRTISEEFAAAAPQVPGLIDDVAGAASAIGDVTPQLTGVISRADSILGAVEPGRVGSIVTSVDAFASRLPQIGDDASAIVGNVGGIVTRLDDATATLGEAIRGVRDVVAAVDPAAVDALVVNLRDVTGVISGRAEQIGTFVDNAATASGDIAALSSTLASRTEAVGRALDDASALIGDARSAVQAATPAIEGVGRAIGAISPERITGIVDDVETVTGTLAGQSQAFTRLIAAATDAANGIQSVTSVVAGRSEAIGTALDEAAQLVSRLREAADGAPQLVATADQLLANAASVVDAVDAQAINAVVSDVGTFSSALAAQSGEIEQLVAAASGTAQRAEAIASALAQRAPKIGAVIDNVEAVSADARTFAATLPELTETLRPGIENVASVLSAIDPAAVEAIVTNVRTLSDALGAQTPAVERIVAGVDGVVGDARAIATDVRAVTGEVAGRSAAIGTALDDVQAAAASARQASDALPGLVAAIEPGLTQASEALSAIDPQAVEAIVASARTLADTLGAQAPAVERIVAGVDGVVGEARAIATDVRAVTGEVAGRSAAIGTALDDVQAAAASARQASDALPGLVAAIEPGLTQASEALSAIDPQAVEAIVASARTLADTLGAQAPAVERIVAGVDGVVGDARAIATDVRAVTGEFAGRSAAIGTALDDVQAAAASARQASDALPGLVAAIEPGLNSASEALSAIDPQAVEAIVTNVRTLSQTLSAQAPAIADIITAAQGTAARVEAISSAIAQRTPKIGAIIDDAEAAAGSARAFAATLPELTNTLRPGIENVANVLSAIDPAAVEGIVDDAAALTSTLAGQSGTVTSILASADRVATEAETIATTLSGAAPQVRELVASAERASAQAEAFAARLPGLLDTLEPGLSNASAALSAIDPAAVDAIVTSVRGLAETLSGERERIRSIIASVDGTATRAESIATALSEQSPRIGAIVDSAEAAAQSARTFADTLPAFAETLRPGIDNAAAVLQAVDPAAIADIVDEVNGLAGTLGAQAPQVEQIVATAGVAAEDVAAITGRARGELDTVSAGLDDARAALADVRTFTAALPALRDEIDPAIRSLRAAIAAVDPDAIGVIVGNVRDVTTTLSASRDDFTAIVSTAGSAVQQADQVASAVAAKVGEIGGAIDSVSAFATELGDAAPSIEGVVNGVSSAVDTISQTVAAIDTEAVNGIIADVRITAASIGSRAGAIGAAIDDAISAARDLAEGLGSAGGEDGLVRDVLQRVRRIAVNLEGTSDNIGTLVDRANIILRDEVSDVLTGVGDASGAVQRLAAAFAPRAPQIADGLARFSQSGLDDLRSVLDQGRSTLAAIESAVSSFDRNPNRVIFGGDNAPQYSPQRR